MIVKCECGLTATIRIWPYQCRCRRVYMNAGDVVPKLTTVAAIPFSGPGTELKKLLELLGIKSFEECHCESRMLQMNRWGVEGCRENFETIRGWIAESQSASGWSVMISAGARAAASGIALRIDPLDVAGSLVRIAIERAEN
jgi:hypothetical protein